MTPKKLKSFGLALIVVIASAIGVATAHAAASYLLAYPKAGYETSSSVFTLKADTTSVDVVRYYSKFSYAHLAYQGTTTFTVSLISGATITSFDISPHSYGLNVTATKSGANLTFSVPQVNSRYLLVRISIAFQGGLALYYYTRRRHVETFLRETPAWIRRQLLELNH